jgi:hypothetical protein
LNNFRFAPIIQISITYHRESRRAEFQGIWDKTILSSRASGAFPVAFPSLKDASSSRSLNLHYISDDYFSDRVNRIFNSQLPVITSDNKIDLS